MVLYNIVLMLSESDCTSDGFLAVAILRREYYRIVKACWMCFIYCQGSLRGRKYVREVLNTVLSNMVFGSTSDRSDGFLILLLWTFLFFLRRQGKIVPFEAFRIMSLVPVRN
jgi:hypothetical protein